MAKQGGITTLKNIAKAYTTALPVSEKWYQDRLEICNGCEFNSKNVDTSKFTMLEDLSFSSKKTACLGKDHCTACGCCIKRKASVKAEQCGIAKLPVKERLEKNLNIKWPALEIDIDNIEEVNMTNLTPEKGVIKKEAFNFVYDLGEVPLKTVGFSFSLFRARGFEVKDYAAGCKCSVGAHRQINKNICEFDMTISTESFSPNIKTSRTFDINYYVGNGKTKKITIIFKLIKK